MREGNHCTVVVVAEMMKVAGAGIVGRRKLENLEGVAWSLVLDLVLRWLVVL